MSGYEVIAREWVHIGLEAVIGMVRCENEKAICLEWGLCSLLKIAETRQRHARAASALGALQEWCSQLQVQVDPATSDAVDVRVRSNRRLVCIMKKCQAV